jgi:hypothetical protein
MEAWAVLKDRQTRAALLNLVKSLAAAPSRFRPASSFHSAGCSNRP